MITNNILHEQWRKDSEIDSAALDTESLNIPKLHSKYLYLLDEAKDTLREKEYQYLILLKQRTAWYEGTLSKEEMDELGWDYDPYHGKLIKTKIQRDHYLKTDTVLLNHQILLDQIKQQIDTIKEILEHVKWRGNLIRNAIEFRKFQAGV